MLIRKLFRAEMAHMVPGAYSTRCHHLHGHSYKYEVFFRSDRPNAAHMVADFKAIKDIGVNDFLDSFDHAVMMWEKDPRTALAAQMNPERHIIVPFIPTAEMMAKAFFVVCQAIVDVSPPLSGEDGYGVDHVIVHETETGYASFGQADLAGDGFPSIAFERWRFSDGIRNGWNRKEWFPRVLQALGGAART